ncbi:glutamate-1-semialdehyde 2,1-aminomutase [Solirubrobacter pauli]|uniref:Glutamate-1-semialdehyde 2,1-aminomutase n=1 Tax=Solirubrobacter pauli TaxID=166793 RepID=A0A660LKF8_9ACTN|nr:aminotransferase class III-fold pyridoxal phosphate-dependent enzyme [Solirubrobacter pauli]RKQ93731.1 glutamate-1-semialdehyde 2,1-aminomutase [Solirubrobacter pauli]
MTAREEAVAPGSDPAVAGALRDSIARYVAANPASAARAERAAAALPGGNTRSVLHYDPFPLAFARADGAYLHSLDGRRYTDFLGEYTAGLYGHSHPVILDAIRGALDRGLNYGGHSALEGELAERLCARFTAMERVRFTNSGTEANLMALALALHQTGRREVLAFKGGYHGGVLAFGAGKPSPVTVPHAWVLGDFDDVDGTRELIRAHDLGAILVEPMQGSGGSRPASRAFLAMLREEATRAGAVLIFDEVMTSRLWPRAEPGFDGVVPDLMTVGKYLAGGMSFGAFGGRADLMSAYDPTRPDALFHAGTFNNNVLSMSAGLAGLTHVLTDDALEELNARGDRLRAQLDAVVPTTGRGSLMTMHPGSDERRQLLFFELLDAGYWIAGRGMIALSLPLTDEQCDAFAAAVAKIIGAC